MEIPERAPGLGTVAILGADFRYDSPEAAGAGTKEAKPTGKASSGGCCGGTKASAPDGGTQEGPPTPAAPTAEKAEGVGAVVHVDMKSSAPSGGGQGSGPGAGEGNGTSGDPSNGTSNGTSGDPEQGAVLGEEAAPSDPEGNATAPEEAEAVLTLSGVTVDIQPGETVAVVGSVGSGKSSLLAALLGEVPIVAGSVQVQGTIAYADQSPYITNATVKANILFGHEFHEERYEETVRVCCLGPDLASLPDGDQTEIGERGVTLSGGQKARMSLARAVYADADIVVLDDPLSAVDSHVARALFTDVISGCLAAKTLVFATNHVHFLEAHPKPCT